MALVSCPSCQKKISDKASVCSECDYSFDQDESELERLKVLHFRKYRDTKYRLKMLSYVAIAIALFGVVPMVWDYLKAMDYGFQVNLLNHWGINPVMLGFAMYVVVRILMLNNKRNYKAHKKNT